MKHLSNYLTVNLLLLPLLSWGFNNSFCSLPDTNKTFPDRAPKVKANEGIPANGYNISTIVIDAGHGGHDPGCSGSGSREKHLALAISLKVAQLLRQQYPDLKVILTRDKDVFVPLYERAAIANRAKADLFLSIHCNFMPKLDWVKGSETYVMGLHTAEHNLKVAKRENAAILLEADYEKNYDYDPNSPEGHIMLSMVQNVFLDQSILFAELVEKQMHFHAGRKSRGVKQAGFVVLKETMMPSILVEAGFLSNAAEEHYLKSSSGQTSIAQSIVKAFGEYKAEVEETDGPIVAGTAPKQAKPMDPLAVEPQPLSTPGKQPVVVKTELNEQPQGAHAAFAWEKEEVKKPKNPAKGFDPVVKTSAPKVVPITKYSTTRSSTSVPPPVYVRDTKQIPEPGSQEPKPEYFRSDLPVYYRIQLAASKNPLPASSREFAAVTKPVEVIVENGFYKYQVLQINSYEEGMELVSLLRMKGFVDAFLAAYQNGKRVDFQQPQALEK